MPLVPPTGMDAPPLSMNVSRSGCCSFDQHLPALSSHMHVQISSHRLREAFALAFATRHHAAALADFARLRVPAAAHKIALWPAGWPLECLRI